MEIISKRRAVKVENWARDFTWNTESGAGFSFPCDRQGNLLMDKIPSTGRGNLQGCLSGEYDVTPQSVKDYSHTYYEPACGKCDCGRIVELFDPMTNTCDCGLEYNCVGQLLAPRSQWGDEWVVQPEEDYGLY